MSRSLTPAELALIVRLSRLDPALIQMQQVWDQAAALWPADAPTCVYESVWEPSTLPLLRTFVGSDRCRSPRLSDEAERALRDPAAYELVRRWSLERMPRCRVPGCWCPLATS